MRRALLRLDASLDGTSGDDTEPEAAWLEDAPWQFLTHQLAVLAPLALPGEDCAVARVARRRPVDVARGFVRAVRRRDWLQAAGAGRWLVLLDEVPQTLGLCLLGVVVWAILGLGLGTLIKNQIAAILTAVGFVFIVEPLATALFNHYAMRTAPEYFPGAASQAVVQGVQFQQGAQTLVWWAGALVLIGYGVVFAVLGALLTLRRDVT